MPKITVILVAYYGDKWLPACLESLVWASTQKLHLLLVDNAGNDRISELNLSRFSTEIISTQKPLGFAEANNYALVNARYLGKYILFLNQDTISLPGWIDQCLQIFENVPEMGALSPLIRNYDNTSWDSSFLTCLDHEQRQLLKKNGKNIFYTKVAPAPALIVSKEVLAETGPFDPVFGSYYEDYDLCLRIRQGGHKIAFCRSAYIQHFSGSSTVSRQKELKRMRQVIRNRILFELREFQGSRWLEALIYFLWRLPHRFGRGVIGTSSSQPPVVTLKAYWDLLMISRRLFSKDKDEIEWEKYLRTLEWYQLPQFITSKTRK